MRTDSNSSGRRSSRRGGSRNYRNNDRRSSSSSYPAKTTKSAPAKKSFWEKIISFFTGEKSAAPKKPQTSPVTKFTSSESRETRGGIRKPEAVDVTSPKLYVGNLSFDATESDLSDLFNGVGHVQLAEVVSHKVTQKSKGFAFVTMQTTEEAKRAVEVLHDKDFMGRKLVVSGAKTSDVRSNAA
jgi:RNA recognition motif-containing protein